MTRRGDPGREDAARRAAIADALTGGGMDPEVADRWCDAWEAEAALRDLKRDDDYWQAGRHRIDAQCAARKHPAN